MRLSTDKDRDETRARATIVAAADAGITVFDTARAYGHGDAELGHNERLLAAALREDGRERRARIVTKGGMTRTGGGWVPDGRAKAIAADCEASRRALGGLPIDLYLLHAPDPRTPWRTSVRALARLADRGLVERVGLSNVNLPQLDEALELAPVSAVQVALSVFDDRALRGGVVERCTELGISVLAHSPLGGPRRARGLSRHRPWIDVARAQNVEAAEIALAWLLELSPTVIALPGARRPETARLAAHAAGLRLGGDDRHLLSASRRPGPPQRRPRPTTAGAETVVVMGIPGAGKSRVAARYEANGYLRLNRDDRGGSLRALAATLEAELSAGALRVVLDNTYLTRASRSYVVEAAGRHDVPARCVWVQTPLAQAQVNLVERVLEQVGTLPGPADLPRLARTVPGVLTPTSQMRALRELEPPSDAEGFADVEVVPFAREEPAEPAARAVFVAAAVLRMPGWKQAIEATDRGAPHLVFDWMLGAPPTALDHEVQRLASAVSGPVERALCPHPGGPPSCWCRPPLPGLLLAFARAHGLEPRGSLLIGTSAAHRALAAALDARFLAA